MFNHNGCQYSVPPEYIGKHVILQIYDGYIHVYYSTRLVTIHSLSRNKINYHSGHYEAVARRTHVFKEDKIKDIATKNLKIIGDVYHYE